MWTEPALTYRGALSILGKYDRPIFDRLERLVSVSVLGGGLLELVDPKNDGVRLLRGFLDGVHGTLLGVSGYDRLQLIAAAHTTVVVSSFFEALQAQLGPSYDELEFTDAEKVRLATGRVEQPRLDALSQAPVPIPGPRFGFRENLDERLVPYYARLAADCAAFVCGLARAVTLDQADLVRRAVATYEATFVRLAADVPEFGFWLVLGESSETRREVRTWGGELVAATGRRFDVVEELLSRLVTGGAPPSLEVLGALHRSVLARPVLGDPAVDAVATLPTVEQAYIAPSLRVAEADRASSPADPRWWADQRLVSSPELFFADYLTSPSSVSVPLLVLGLPGAGKSMLTQMLAARLPVAGWTAVRVPLRRVRADAPIATQIQEALDLATHGRIGWAQLVEDAAAAGTTRVVVLDGLDELMQASGVSQSRYLYEVAEFQAVEAALGRPVAVVVTSRTVMADRVVIPPGTLVVRLESFSDEQVAQWLSVWNGLNAGSPGFRALSSVPPALAELGRQPLLLLLIALYTADPSAPSLDSGVTTAVLYERLVTHFLRREALKEPRADVERFVAERRWPLTLAAFAMLNRGRTYVTEPELGADLAAFLGTSPEPVDHIVRTVGRFFFVHASVVDATHGLPATYEFLHSTFGEYLVASHLAAQLRLTARRPGPGGPPDSDRLRALLSHVPLVTFPRVLEFFTEAAAEVLPALVADARRTLTPWTPAAYNPSGRDVLDHYAIYTLNLVSLGSDRRVPLADLAPAGTDAVAWWRSLVRQWRAALDDEAWLAVVGTLTVRPGWVLERASSRAHLGTAPANWLARGEARLLGDVRLDALVGAGAAAWRGTVPTDTEAAVVFAGLVEMQLHGVIHPRVVRAAVALDDRLPPPAFDVLLTLVTRVATLLAQGRSERGSVEHGIVLALIDARTVLAQDLRAVARIRDTDTGPSAEAVMAGYALDVRLLPWDEPTDWNELASSVLALARRRIAGRPPA
ncbi:NACHT domain-containing protein [Cryptosporangium arvum]|uniref:NACHT N-terminal Helical domain-containing protein n=1 Tax=Cryptosporangium arvum DSM 44712 TaxID=927661 RepID=A0A010YIY5_9ACTN|nr:hypothetical protein [Cryptosporangium arvum]EXG80195.1 hypothetical protein CryarDRAFT_1261 [Cryptosporangium arvum DSM 44712]